MAGRIGTIKTFASATGRDLHIDAPLTNMTVGYRPKNLIADQILPTVTVPKQSDLYYIWPKAEWLRSANVERAPGTRSPRVHFSVSSAAYFAPGYALAMEIPYEDIDNSDAVLDIRQSAANFVLDKLMIAWEQRIATLLTTAANVGSNTSLTNAWSDEINGDPVNDIYTGFESIRSTTGLEPNTMLISGRSWNNLRKHPDIIDFVRGKGDNRGGGPVKEADIAAAFGLDKVLVGKGVINTAEEDAPGVYTEIWSTACILLHVAPNPGKMVPGYGYTFQWTPPSLPAPFGVSRRNDDDIKAEIVEVMHYQDELVVATDLGYLMVNC